VPLPNFEGKHQHPAYIEPKTFIDKLRALGKWQDFPPLAGVILVYGPGFLARTLSREQHQPHPGLQGEFHIVSRGGGTIGLSGGFGIGAPAATVVMEDLIALGVQSFISIGSAGGLQPELGIGGIIVCDRAIRDEGVSHHYLPSGTYAYPSPSLTLRLRTALESLGSVVRVGTTWTIDAPYRETVEEVRRYRSEGVLTVEMEAAALAAVAFYRKVDFATAFTISDQLCADEWDPQFWSDENARGQDLLFEAAARTLVAGL
jgi:uridine phosphorylase